MLWCIEIKLGACIVFLLLASLKYGANSVAILLSKFGHGRKCLENRKGRSSWNGVKELEQRENHLIQNEMNRSQTD